MLSMDRDARAAIREFVLDRLAPTSGHTDIGDEDDLIDSGIIDSLGIFQLVAFLEDRFGIAIGDEEITPENFGSVMAIERLVASRSR
jgi:acyl carrier protein